MSAQPDRISAAAQCTACQVHGSYTTTGFAAASSAGHFKRGFSALHAPVACTLNSTGWLCRALEEHGVVSYGEVTRHTLGRSGQRLVDTLLIVSQTGAAWRPKL